MSPSSLHPYPELRLVRLEKEQARRRLERFVLEVTVLGLLVYVGAVCLWALLVALGRL